MQLLLFSKFFPEKNFEELIEIAKDLGLDGYDLAIRPDNVVNPDNVGDALPEAVKAFAGAGLSIPMVSGDFDLLEPDHPTAEPILTAMAKAGVSSLKLGYWTFKPLEDDYWVKVDQIRDCLAGWQELAKQYQVQVCYHTHSGNCMGMNAGMLMHLLRGFDPRYIAAYLDPAHLLLEGESFLSALSMVGDHLSLIGAKDVLLTRNQQNGHGGQQISWVEAGHGMVDWRAVFDGLRQVNFDGPISLHCQFTVADNEFIRAVKRDVAFYRSMIDTRSSGSNRHVG